MTNPFVQIRELEAEFEYNFSLYNYWRKKADREMMHHYFHKCTVIQNTIRPLLKQINTPISEKETFILN